MKFENRNMAISILKEISGNSHDMIYLTIQGNTCTDYSFTDNGGLDLPQNIAKELIYDAIKPLSVQELADIFRLTALQFQEIVGCGRTSAFKWFNNNPPKDWQQSLISDRIWNLYK